MISSLVERRGDHPLAVPPWDMCLEMGGGIFSHARLHRLKFVRLEFE